MTIPANPIRKSVPTADLERWWGSHWAYVMPDFSVPNHSFVEWLSDKPPVYPNRVPETNQTESADDERTAERA